MYSSWEVETLIKESTLEKDDKKYLTCEKNIIFLLSYADLTNEHELLQNVPSGH